MKCDRCGSDIGVTSIGDYALCEICILEFLEFMKGAKLCNCNKAYFTVMYEEDIDV